jgi:hypothetical protein
MMTNLHLSTTLSQLLVEHLRGRSKTTVFTVFTSALTALIPAWISFSESQHFYCTSASPPCQGPVYSIISHTRQAYNTTLQACYIVPTHTCSKTSLLEGCSGTSWDFRFGTSDRSTNRYLDDTTSTRCHPGHDSLTIVNKDNPNCRWHWLAGCVHSTLSSWLINFV